MYLYVALNNFKLSCLEHIKITSSTNQRHRHPTAVSLETQSQPHSNMATSASYHHLEISDVKETTSVNDTVHGWSTFAVSMHFNSPILC